jgi:hypothetical protein
MYTLDLSLFHLWDEVAKGKQSIYNKTVLVIKENSHKVV